MSEPRIGSLCTGYGGLDLAAQAVFGGELAWWSDIDPGPIKVMEHHHPGLPNLGDLKSVDWAAVRAVDILTAGYPCQPFSNAGKRLGTEDPRHIWPWIADAIGVLRPRIVLLENVSGHLRRGFDIVSADLAGLGYRFAWGVVSAAEAGAPHLRKRLYVVALAEDTNGTAGGERRVTAPGETEAGGARADASRRVGTPSADTHGEFLREQPWWGGGSCWADSSVLELASSDATDEVQDWVQYEPAIRRWERALGVVAPIATIASPRAKSGRTSNPAVMEWMMGVPGRISSVPGLDPKERKKLAGNGVVPQQAELAIRTLLRSLEG